MTKAEASAEVNSGLRLSWPPGPFRAAAGRGERDGRIATPIVCRAAAAIRGACDAATEGGLLHAPSSFSWVARLRVGGGKKPGQCARGWPRDPGNFDWFGRFLRNDGCRSEPGKPHRFVKKLQRSCRWTREAFFPVEGPVGLACFPALIAISQKDKDALPQFLAFTDRKLLFVLPRVRGGNGEQGWIGLAGCEGEVHPLGLIYGRVAAGLLEGMGFPSAPPDGCPQNSVFRCAGSGDTVVAQLPAASMGQQRARRGGWRGGRRAEGAVRRRTTGWLWRGQSQATRRWRRGGSSCATTGRRHRRRFGYERHS